MAHELFVLTHSHYYYDGCHTGAKPTGPPTLGAPVFTAATTPVVRVDMSQGLPMQYRSGNWDFGWFYCRSDGHAAWRRADPYTGTFSDHALQCAMRWFIR